jgi:peptide/nickel transport system substrate-binding protein
MVARGTPNGNPDRIEWRFGTSPNNEAQAVLHGQADLAGDLPTNLNALARNHPLQIHSNTFPTVFFVQLNTHDPPFTSVRVRRALNYAVDRATVARMYGALANTPTCQMIPPGLPGYHRYCPYRLDLTRNGRWIAPNLQRAHALADTSDTRGKAVTIWDITDTGSAEPLVPYLARLLRHLGYRPDIHVLTPAQLNRRSPAARARVDLLPVTFGPDYPTRPIARALMLRRRPGEGGSNGQQVSSKRHRTAPLNNGNPVK